VTDIQDYVNIYGLKIWQEEFSRIVNFNVEQESNQFVKRKIMDWQSEFQSEAVPIPRFNPLDDGSLNFMGRICQELLLHSNCTTTTYLNQMSAWFDRDGRELIGMKTFALLMRSVEVFGVIGIDLLMSFMIARDLVQLLNKIRLFVSRTNSVLRR
jgi:WASH complex subunit strumpellin